MTKKEMAHLFALLASLGGKARAKKLSAKRRSEIARRGGKAKAARPKD